MSSKIFKKSLTLKPSAMRTVAERRFRDAETLVRTGDNERANGAVYLAGIAVEILLKAMLVELNERVAKMPAHQLNGLKSTEREIWTLIWRQHDLEKMLLHLPHLAAALSETGNNHGVPYLDYLKSICAGWTIHARYSSQSSLNAKHATTFFERVRKLKEHLK